MILIINIIALLLLILSIFTGIKAVITRETDDEINFLVSLALLILFVFVTFVWAKSKFFI